MPPEPLPWDRKDFFKERKHERSESIGSVARWRDSAHHGSREFNRWGSSEFRRPPGHGKQGGWHLFSEESGHGYGPSRSSIDKMLEHEGCRPSVSRGDGKYGRGGRESRGSFSQRDWRGHSWETSNGAPNIPRRPQHDANSDLRSEDDMLPYSCQPHSDFVSTWDQIHLNDQHDKIGGANGIGTGQRCERENSLGPINWKHLKWTRAGNLSSRGSGLSHLSNSKSVGAVDSNGTKSEVRLKNATPIRSLSVDAATCVTSAPPSEEMTSRKKPRLGWGEGLAKYEKKKVEGPDVGPDKDGVSFSWTAESTRSLGSSLAEKSPRVLGFSGCASPATPSSIATPSSVACSSSPGIEEKSFSKTASYDTEISNLCGSPSPGLRNQLEGFSFTLEKLDIKSISSLGTSLIELLQSDDLNLVESSFMRSSALNKLLICKSEVSKELELTESEIDSLENELKSLRSENGVIYPQLATSGVLPMEDSVNYSKEKDVVINLSSRPSPLQMISSGDMPICNGDFEAQTNMKGEDVDSPGTVTSKFVEPLSLMKAITSHEADIGNNVHYSSNSRAVQCTDKDKYLVYGSCERKEDVFQDVPMTSEADEPICDYLSVPADQGALCDSILAFNKESAIIAAEVFNKLLGRSPHKTNLWGNRNDSFSQSAESIKEKFAMRKQFLRFKERVITLKFKVFHRLWKEDMHLLSMRKFRAKPQRKVELSLRVTHNGHQKNRFSIRSRFSSPEYISLHPSMDVVNFTSKLLSDPQTKLYRTNLKMPALILDKKEKMASRFVSGNGLVEDPCAVEKERAMINPWTSEEKEVFMDKLATFGKDFCKIASFLSHKTTADCVEFYYKNHKSDCFKKTKKKLEFSKQSKSSISTYLVTSGKKWNREMNAASLDMLGAASVMAAHADRQRCSGRLDVRGNIESKISRGNDGISQRSRSSDIFDNERETVAADVLAGIGSLSSEAMSSCITSSVIKRPSTPDVKLDVNDDTCSDESCGEMDPSHWTDEEKSIFVQAVSSYGKDFTMISRCLRTRSRDQCKVFFSKAKKCLGLDLMRPGNVGTSVSGDDTNGGGSDSEDACVMKTRKIIRCGKSDSKTDEELLLSFNIKNEELITAEVFGLQSLSRSNKLLNRLDPKDSDACQEGNTHLAFSGVCNFVNSASNQESLHEQRSTVVSVNSETGRDQVTEQRISAAESISVQEANYHVSSNAEAVGQSIVAAKVSSRVLENGSQGREEKNYEDTSSQIDLQCSVHESSGHVSHLAADRSSSSGLNLEVHHQVTIESDSVEKPCMNSFPEETSVVANSVATKTNDRLSSILDFRESTDEHLLEHARKDHCVEQSPGVLSHVNLHQPPKNRINGDFCCTNFSEVKISTKLDKGNGSHYLASDCSLRKCSTVKPHCSVSELPLLSKKTDKTSDHAKFHSRSSSDSDIPYKHGDVKLFGQVLSHPATVHKLNCSSNENEEKSQYHKLHSKSSNVKPTDHHKENANSGIINFDGNNAGLENVPLRSYGFWDGSRIQTGFSSLPDSATLLAKYPAAFSSYSVSCKMENQPLLPGSTSNDRDLNNKVSVYPVRDSGSGDGVINYQLHRSQDGGSEVQPFTVDVKHRQDILIEMQRRKGFEAISSLQPQRRGMVGVNVGNKGGGIFVGGPCTGVSDPVAAMKMHYAKADQYGGQTGSIREDET